MNSMYFGSVYENPSNEKIKYDPQKALQLLAEAGWKDRDSAGHLIRSGQPLTMEIVYANAGLRTLLHRLPGGSAQARHHAESPARHVGNLIQAARRSGRSRWRSSAGHRRGVSQPGGNFHSSLADQKNTNNITGFKNKRVDEIWRLYDKEFDGANRVELLRELDGILANEHHYIFMWDAPFQRFVFWNKFGYPQGARDAHWATIAGTCRRYGGSIRKNPATRSARMKRSFDQFGEGPSEDRYWHRVREERGANQQCGIDGDELFSPAVAADRFRPSSASPWPCS